MNDKVDSSRFSKVQVDDEESADEKLQTKLTRFVSKSKSNLSVLSSKTYTKLEPIILVLKNNIVRYSISAILFVLVIFLYILYELPSVIEDIVLRASLVPIGLILATIAILYVTWDDQYLKKFRTPGIYVVILTTIFYIFIYTDISELLFSTTLATWLTRSTGAITSAVVAAFGINIFNTLWISFPTYERIYWMDRTTYFLSSPSELISHLELTDIKWMTKIVFSNAPSGQGSLYIDAACSGIHSLTVFTAIFLIMLFEARKRLQWNYKTILIALVGIIGTYIMNLIRIMIIISIYYYQGPSVGEPVHNFLGYALLIIWLPIFWLYILPLAEKKEVKEERKLRKKEKREKKEEKKSEKEQTKDL